MILVCGEALIDLLVGAPEGNEMPARAGRAGHGTSAETNARITACLAVIRAFCFWGGEALYRSRRAPSVMTGPASAVRVSGPERSLERRPGRPQLAMASVRLASTSAAVGRSAPARAQVMAAAAVP